MVGAQGVGGYGGTGGDGSLGVGGGLSDMKLTLCLKLKMII